MGVWWSVRWIVDGGIELSGLQVVAEVAVQATRDVVAAAVSPALYLACCRLFRRYDPSSFPRSGDYTLFHGDSMRGCRLILVGDRDFCGASGANGTGVLVEDFRNAEASAVDPINAAFEPFRSTGRASPSCRDHLLVVWKGRLLPDGYKPVVKNRYGQLIAVKVQPSARPSNAEFSNSSTSFVYGTPVLMPNLAGHQNEKELARTISSSPCIGHFAAIADTETGVAFATDHLGSIPIYISDGVAGTHLFDVAKAAGVSSIDPVAVSEFLQHGYITSPFTIFEDVKRLDPGSVFSVVGDRTNRTTYWQPKEDPEARISDVAEEAFDIMDQNLSLMIGAYPAVTLLYSGGEDSRVLARLLRQKTGPQLDELHATTFLGHRNREYRLAVAAARILGLRHCVKWRGPDLYIDAATGFADALGGVYDARNFHSWNLLQGDDADIFVDGWTADTFMKGLYLPKVRRKFWKFQYGLQRPVPFEGIARPDGELGEEVQHRRLQKLSKLKSFRQSDPETYLWMWPISDHPDYGFFASNQALRPTATPFMYGNFVDVVTRLPETKKATNQLFWLTFGRKLGVSGFVPRSGGEIPRLPPILQPPFIAFAQVSGAVGARVRNRLGLPSKAQGPWLDREVIKSSALRAIAGFDPECLRIAFELRHDWDSKGRVDLGPEYLRVLQIAQLLRDGTLSV